MSVQVYLWKPSYYRYLYGELLKEIQQNANSGIVDVPKWKKDILFLLLKKANEPCPSNNKSLREEVENDTRKISDKAWKKVGKNRRKIEII